MGLRGWTMSNCTRAGIKGVEIAFYTGRIEEKVTVGSANAMKPVRVCDQTAAGNALISSGTVAANSI